MSDNENKLTNITEQIKRKCFGFIFIDDHEIH